MEESVLLKHVLLRWFQFRMPERQRHRELRCANHHKQLSCPVELNLIVGLQRGRCLARHLRVSEYEPQTLCNLRARYQLVI